MHYQPPFRARILVVIAFGIITLIGGFALVQAPVAQAAMKNLGLLSVPSIPATFNYQGILRQADGSLTNGTLNITANIYDAAFGGSSLHTETFNSVNVRDGVFNIVLGDQVSLDSTFDATPRFIGISLNGGDEIIPRERVHSVPWAIHASNASEATHATNADNALTAGSASLATRALNADSANNAVSAQSFSGMFSTSYTADASSTGVSVKTLQLWVDHPTHAMCELTTAYNTTSGSTFCSIDPFAHLLTASNFSTCTAYCIGWAQ